MMTAYEYAKSEYAKFGIDTEAAIKKLSEVVKKKAVGDDAGARALLEDFRDSFGKYESEIRFLFDHVIYFSRYTRIFSSDQSKIENAITATL